MTSLPPIPAPSPRDASLPPIPPRPEQPEGLPSLASRNPGAAGVRPAAPITTAPPKPRPVRRRRPPAPLALIAAVAVGAGAIGGALGARLGGDATTAPPPASSIDTPSTPPVTPIDTGAGLSSAVATAAPSVVAVRSSSGLGSGVALSDRGLVVTNHHVVGDDRQVAIITADNREVTADVVASDADQDLAVLRPTGPVGTGAQMATEPNGGLRAGDQVFAIGNPFGLQNTVTSGIVSYINRPGENGVAMIQTDAPINPGNSGGGLFDLRGRLVGIPTSIKAPIRGNVGIGFAVPVSRVVELLQRIP